MKKRTISILLTACLLIGLLPSFTTTAHATGEITLSAQNDKTATDNGYGPGYGAELTSGEAGNASATPGVEIYFTDLTGNKAGIVNTAAYGSWFGTGETGNCLFHASVSDPNSTYENDTSTKEMVIRKTDGTNFSLQATQFKIAWDVTLVITGYRNNAPTGVMEYPVTTASATPDVDLNPAVSYPAFFQNVDKVTVTGKGYGSGNSTPNGQLDSSGVVLTKSVTIGDPITPDTTAPTLSAVSATNEGTDAATLNFTSDEAGTYYYLVYTAADTAPSADAVKAQGTAVAKGTGTAAVSANTAGISGLTDATEYKVYVVEADAAGNVSAVSNASFTTLSKTIISSAAVTVTAPAKGAVPSTDAAAENGANYTVSTGAWGGNPAKFLGGNAYTATLTLTPKAGYKFTADTTVTVAGATVTKTLNSDGTLQVSAAYPALDAAALTGITVKTQPAKVAYTYGDSFAPAGLVITETFDDGSTSDVTYDDSTKSGFAFSPTALSAGTTSVMLTYGGKTASIPVSVAKQSVTAPEIASSTYTGENQTATVAASNLYTVTTNAGGTNAGGYSVILTLKDSTNYKWSDSDSGTKTLTFTITKADATDAMKTVSTSVSSLGKTGATVTLPTLPDGAGYGTVTYSGNVVCSSAVVSGTTLTYNAAAITAGQNGTITISVTGAKNYNDYSVEVTVTSVAKTEVSITGLTAASGLIYNGSPQNGYAGTATVTGHTDLNKMLVYTYASTDGAGYSSPTAPTAAGAYQLTVSVSDSNETYTGSASVNFTIAPKELNITGLTATNRAYNGSTDIALTGGTLEGKIGSDDVTATMPTVGTVAAADVENAKAVTVAKPSLIGSAAANYTLANLPTITVNISPAVLKVIGADGVTVTKAYDGTAAAGTLSGTLTFSGKIGTEDVSVSATPGAYASNAVEAGTGKTVELALSLSGTGKANYTMGSNTYSFTNAAITKRNYGGSAIEATLGVPVGDTSAGTVSASTFTLPDGFKNAAIVSVSEASDANNILTLTGDSYSILPTADTQSASCAVVISSDNYNDVTATLRFAPANKVLTNIAVKTAPTKTSYVVGNKFDPSGLVLTLTYEDGSNREVVYNDSTKANFTFSPAANTTLAKTVSAVSVSYGGKTVSQTITVGDKHKISIQWKDLYNLVYDGSTKYPTFEATGVLNGADVTVAMEAGSKTHINAGSYTATITLSGADVLDYTIVNPSAEFSIQKTPVTVTLSGDTVAKNTAINPTVTTSPNVAVTLSYRDSSGNTATPTSSAVGSYDIYASISDGNYRFSDTTDGTAKKIGVLTIYDVEPTKYTVSFSGGEGATGTVTALTAAQAGTIRTMPANSYTKANAKFVGWTYDGKTYQPGDTFPQPAGDAAITAVWQSRYGISGTVRQDGNAVSGAVVTLMLGNEQIAQSVTDATGNYTFSDVTPGLYNLVATKDGITQTSAVKITSSNVNDLLITLPSGKTNTIVEVVAGTPDIVVGGLDDTVKTPTASSKVYTTSDKAVVDAGGSVDVKLTADVNNNTENQTTINQSSVKAADVTIGLFLDFDIMKTVKDSNDNQLSSTPIKETDDLIELTIDIPASLQGAKNYVVYRLHEGAVQELRTTPNAAGEYIVINSNNTITVYAKYFSVYGLGYTTVLDITFNGNGGTASTGTMTTDTNGKLAALPTATRSGYTFNGWYTEATGGTQITTGTVFTENTTAYAHWTPSGGTSNSGTSSSSTSHAITAPAASNGTAKLSTSSAASGTKITVTVTPESGYALKTLTIKDANGNTVNYTDNGNSTYTFTMPSTAVTVSAVFYKLPTSPDVTGVSSVLQTVDHIKYISGYSNRTVGPERNMTRGEVAQMFYNLLLDQSAAATAKFSGVPDTLWCAKAINKLVSLGIIKGYDNGAFGVNDPVTREQFCAIAVRFAAKIKTGSVEYTATFSDIKSGTWSYDSVMAAAALGWIGGYADGRFGPKDNITRAQVVTIVNHMLGRAADKSFVDSSTSIKTFTDLSKSYWAYYDIMEATNAHDYKTANGSEAWSALK